MPKLSNDWTIYEAAHLLNRAGFGGTPEEIRTLYGRGREGAVSWLLDAEESEDYAKPGFLGQIGEVWERYAALRQESKTLSKEEADKKRRELNQQVNRERRQQGVTLTQWWMERMRTTEAPLREKMVMFWHDHFPTSVQKVRRPKWMYEQNELFREEALGNFGELTRKVALDPAMMTYLDSANSSKKKPNENFARELMELFTLGEGNYTEEDVKEAARAFTGYRVQRVNGVVNHVARSWDDGEKVILGQRGAFDGPAVVELVLKKPACGEYLAKKVFEYFCYDNPSEEVVKRLGRGFVKVGYEVKPLLREIFLSEEFYSERAMYSRIKSPVEFVVMMAKQLEVGGMPERLSMQALTQLGQVPFLPPNVAGWDWGKAWVNTNTLLTRYHLAGLITGAGGDPKMVTGGRGGGQMFNLAIARRMPKPDYEVLAPRELREDVSALVEELSFRLFQRPLREKDRVAFESYAKAKRGAIFTNTEIAELMHVMMSTPSYQLA